MATAHFASRVRNASNSVKWRILSQPAKIGSGKNKKIFIFPTGLEDHLEDMF